MKKLLCILIFIELIASPVFAWKMKMEPLGWNGWAWGTPLKDIAGGLSYSGRLNDQLPFLLENRAMLFIKGDTPITFAEWEWEEFYCIVLDEKLVGILFQETRHPAATFFVFEYLCQGLSENLDDLIETNDWDMRSTKGTFASVIYISMPDADRSYNKPRVSWIIGAPGIVDGWIDKLYQNNKEQ